MQNRLLSTLAGLILIPAIISANKSDNKIELLSSSDESSVVKISVGSYQQETVNTQYGSAVIINAKDATPILLKGAPNLPKFSFSIAIGDNARMEYEIVSSTFTDLPGIEIAPSKGTLTRNADPASIAFTKGLPYSQNTFFPGNLAELRSPYIVRDVRGQAVIVNPFQYNPVTKVLRVYSEIIVRVYKADDNGENKLIVNPFARNSNNEFSEIYRNQFLNHDDQVQYTPLGEYGNMLIISHATYMNAMQPFIAWKKKIGIPVTMVDIATIGNNATAIKAYVQNYYNTNGLTFLLIVGDAQHVASMFFAASGDSDNGYSYLVGNDRYPDILVGRFSAETVPQVVTMVDRVMRYEKFPQPAATWYENGLGIASDQGPGDDNEMDYEHIRNIRTQLMGYTYAGVAELYDGSQGGLDAPGSPTPSMVASVINGGVGIINYTGHGSATTWVSSGFSSTDVDALNNTDKYPFIFSVACVNGDFVGNTCFGEIWQRCTANDGTPAGAIGALMATINQYWDEPMEGMDEMNAILTEVYSTNIKRTFTGIGMNGCMKMNDAYGTSGEDMTDTWTTFGDPSIFVRTDVQGTLTANHVPTETVGVTQLVVNSNTDGARVALTLNGNILGVGTITGGAVTISFPAVMLPDTIYVTLTAYNKIPYFGIVEVLPLVSAQDPTQSPLNFSVYPNPSSSYISISANIPVTAEVKIQVLDVTGKKVQDLHNSPLQVPGNLTLKTDVSSLAEGIYFIRLQTAEQTLTKKIIISR